MGTTQLATYNQALLVMGERQLNSLSENREARRVLDAFWPLAIQYAAEQGIWNFARRITSIASSGTPEYGYSNAFPKPADFVHLFAASASATFSPPLRGDFADIGSSWSANTATLYVDYTSNDGTLGTANPSLWTGTYGTYVAYVLAVWSAFKITRSAEAERVCEGLHNVALARAIAIDHVPAIPGMRPFEIEARTLSVDGAEMGPSALSPFTTAITIPGPAAPQQG